MKEIHHRTILRLCSLHVRSEKLTNFKLGSNSACAGKRRDEMVTPPKFDVIAIEKLPRLLRGSFVVDAFEHVGALEIRAPWSRK
jgi:hypothetical protein